LLSLLAFFGVAFGCQSVGVADGAGAPPFGDVVVTHTVPDAVPVLVELVTAHNAGPEALERVLLDRFGARAARHGRSVVVSGVREPAPLALLFATSALPRCDDPRAGVVVGDPAVVLGCGAQALAGLATFVIAAEATPNVRLILDAGDDAPIRAQRVWGAPGGVIVRGAGGVFDIDAVSAGVVVMTLRRADDDAEALAVALGRALGFRAPARVPLVIAERLQVVPRSPLELFQDPAELLASSPSSVDQVVERCFLEDTDIAIRSGVVAVWCTVLPGRGATDVRDDVVRAIDDPGVSVVVVDSRAATATRFEEPLVQALGARMKAELPGVALAPQLSVRRFPDACERARRQGTPCVAAIPLALHRAELARNGRAEDAVDTAEFGRAAARVVDVVRRLTQEPVLVASPP
jgi:hypothetical protein